MTVISSLSRDQRGKIVEKFDRAQRYLDEVHSSVLSACGTEVRGEAANALLRETDRFADLTAEHLKTMGQLLDALTEEQ